MTSVPEPSGGLVQLSEVLPPPLHATRQRPWWRWAGEGPTNKGVGTERDGMLRSDKSPLTETSDGIVSFFDHPLPTSHVRSEVGDEKFA